MLRALIFGVAITVGLGVAKAEDPMTFERLTEIIQAVDPEAEFQGTSARLTVEEVPVFVVADPTNDRMRAMISIRSIDEVTPDEMYRMMQANFDSALDARYAVAQGRLMSVFIHPLRPLEKDQFLSGLGQVVNLALTYGTAYTGGALTFGGGDSAELHRELIDKLLKQGEPI
ncbi:MAG: hypothetical protein AAF557_27215 [Pseudomonadota bacterium]